jgi:hypothetical protein
VCAPARALHDVFFVGFFCFCLCCVCDLRLALSVVRRAKSVEENEEIRNVSHWGSANPCRELFSFHPTALNPEQVTSDRTASVRLERDNRSVLSLEAHSVDGNQEPESLPPFELAEYAEPNVAPAAGDNGCCSSCTACGTKTLQSLWWLLWVAVVIAALPVVLTLGIAGTYTCDRTASFVFNIGFTLLY